MVEARNKERINSLIGYSVAEENLRRIMAFVSENQVEGDYAEFGVYEGHSFVSAYKFADIFGISSMKFWAFDSFEGLPRVKGIDRSHSWRVGEYSCSKDNFLSKIKRAGLDAERVVVVKGFFDKSLKEKYSLKKLAIVYVDSDLYESAKEVLTFVEPLIQEGTLICFDDWNAFKGRPDYGEQKAFNEFKKKCKKFKFVEFYNSGYNKIFLTLKKTSNKKS